MPTVIPASGLAAFGCALALGVAAGVAEAGPDARMAAGEAAASPAAPVPLTAGCWLAHAVSRQASTAGQAAAASSRPRLARRVGPGGRPPWNPPVACGPVPSLRRVGRAGLGGRPPW